MEGAEGSAEPTLKTTKAGYVVDESNYVAQGPYKGEKVAMCDARWGSNIPGTYRLPGITMTKDEAECIRGAWGLEKSALHLDHAKKPQGTYCIEKMDPSAYKVYLEDEMYSDYEECLDDERMEKFTEHLSVEEPSKFEEFAFLSLAFGGGATAVGMGLNGLIKLAVWMWNKRKPPTPPASGGGGGDVAAREPAAEEAPPPLAFDMKPALEAEAASAPSRSAAETIGLIGAGILGMIILWVAGPGATMGLQGSAAGGTFMLSPGSSDPNSGMYGMGPMA